MLRQHWGSVLISKIVRTDARHKQKHCDERRQRAMQHISDPESSWWLLESEAANYKWNMSVDHKDGTMAHRGRRAAQNGCCTTYRCLHRGRNRAKSWIRGAQKNATACAHAFQNKNYKQKRYPAALEWNTLGIVSTLSPCAQLWKWSIHSTIRREISKTLSCVGSGRPETEPTHVGCKQGLNSPAQRKQLWSRCRAASCPCAWPPSLYCTHGAACRTGEPVSDRSATKTSLQFVAAGSTGQKTPKAKDIRTSKSLRCS